MAELSSLGIAVAGQVLARPKLEFDKLVQRYHKAGVQYCLSADGKPCRRRRLDTGSVCSGVPFLR